MAQRVKHLRAKQLQPVHKTVHAGIDVHLIALVEDALAPPVGTNACDLWRQLLVALAVRRGAKHAAHQVFELVRLRLDVLTQDGSLCELWVAKVHDLVKQLIDSDKVVSYRLLHHHFEVVFEHLQQLVEEGNGASCVDIGLAKRHQIYVCMAQPNEGDAVIVLQHRRGLAALFKL